MKATKIERNQIYKSEYATDFIIKQIYTDYYQKVSYLIYEESETSTREEWYNIQQLENRISDYAYKLQS